jgi:hypothetical protein
MKLEFSTPYPHKPTIRRQIKPDYFSAHSPILFLGDGAVPIVLRLRDILRWKLGSTPGKANNFYFLKNVQTGCGAQHCPWELELFPGR